MEAAPDFIATFVRQLQSPELAFLLAGMLAAALKSSLRIPDAVYHFVVFMLLMRIGLNAGMAIREANFVEMLLPALFSAVLGAGVVFLGSITLAKLPGVKKDDAIATAGLFGAVSSSTLAASMMLLEADGIFYEAWVPALYPFMDIPALVMAIVLANLYLRKNKDADGVRVEIWPIVKECLQGSALTALLLGVVIGLVAQPIRVFEGFYDPLFRGFLSVLMLILGMEAYRHIKDLAKVAHWYIAYSFIAPIVHGLLGFGLGYIAHILVGFSPGGVVMLAVLAASSSDVSGPPTLRAGIPSANPSAYIGSSTSIGTPVALVICIPLFLALGKVVFNL